jgi:hypothetical protein
LSGSGALSTAVTVRPFLAELRLSSSGLGPIGLRRGARQQRGNLPATSGQFIISDSVPALCRSYPTISRRVKKISNSGWVRTVSGCTASVAEHPSSKLIPGDGSPALGQIIRSVASPAPFGCAGAELRYARTRLWRAAPFGVVFGTRHAGGLFAWIARVFSRRWTGPSASPKFRCRFGIPATPPLFRFLRERCSEPRACRATA